MSRLQGSRAPALEVEEGSLEAVLRDVAPNHRASGSNAGWWCTCGWTHERASEGLSAHCEHLRVEAPAAAVREWLAGQREAISAALVEHHKTACFGPLEVRCCSDAVLAVLMAVP